MLMRCLALLAAFFLAAPALATRVVVPIRLVEIAAGADADRTAAPVDPRRTQRRHGRDHRAHGVLQSEPAPARRHAAVSLARRPAGDRFRARHRRRHAPRRPGRKGARARGVRGDRTAPGRSRRCSKPRKGNNFKLRIYPIRAGATRTVELKYAEPLARDGRQWAYRLPLAYGKVQDFDLDIKVNDNAGAPPAIRGSLSDIRFERGAGDYHASFTRQQFTPEGTLDIAVDARDQPAVYRQTVDGATYFVAEMPVASQPSAPPGAAHHRPAVGQLGLRRPARARRGTG